MSVAHPFHIIEWVGGIYMKNKKKTFYWEVKMPDGRILSGGNLDLKPKKKFKVRVKINER